MRWAATGIKILRSRGGFSLVELLIAMSLGLFLLTLLSQTFLLQSRTYSAQEQEAQMTQTLRAGMDMMGREIGMAGYDPAQAGFNGLDLDTNKLKIRADINGDGDALDANETITYQYDTDTRRITRDTGSGPQAFADSVTAFTFEFFQADGTAATSAAGIREVKLFISARTEKPDKNYPENGGYRTMTLVSRITPDNLSL
ncbi:MAG: prepilin-type N-terminal cleavage/methylation domain-containing protein [Proteobacteria bacterium]|nr:prepilin-type N-terminal cleavage/methylation domain-containing protein [Pseudomonadota bacterium]